MPNKLISTIEHGDDHKPLRFKLTNERNGICYGSFETEISKQIYQTVNLEEFTYFIRSLNTVDEKRQGEFQLFDSVKLSVNGSDLSFHFEGEGKCAVHCTISSGLVLDIVNFRNCLRDALNVPEC